MSKREIARVLGISRVAVRKVLRSNSTTVPELPALQVPDRLSLGVQNGLYALDDIFAIPQKQSQQLDICLKRHLT